MISPVIRSRLASTVEFLVPLAALLVISIPLYLKHKDLVSTDGPAYIRRAVYLSQGDFYNSVSSYWSPLYTWVAAGFILTGATPNHAAHLALQSLAAIGVVSFTLLLRHTLQLAWPIRTAAATAFATFIAAWSMRNTSPDGVLASFLILYLAALAHPRFHERRIWPILAGAAAALAYLAKAYALPFVLLHLPLTILLFHRRAGLPLRLRVRVLFIAAVPLALIAGTWVAIVSVKYHRLTVAAVGPRAHALIGPVMRNRYYNELRLPPDPFAIPWENPEDLRYDYWSPFDSASCFRHQIGIITSNLGEMVRDLHWIAVGYVAAPVLLAAVLAICIRRMPLGERRLAAWILVTLLLYGSGYICVIYIQRYMFYIIHSLILLLGLMLVSGFRNVQAGRSPGRLVAAMLLILAFAVPGLVKAREFHRSSFGMEHHKALARQIQQKNLPGSIAAGDTTRGIVFAHFANRKLIGFPSSGDNARECCPTGVPVTPEAIDRQLRDAGVGLLLVTRYSDESRWADPGIAVAQRAGWQFVAKSGPLHLYARTR